MSMQWCPKCGEKLSYCNDSDFYDPIYYCVDEEGCGFVINSRLWVADNEPDDYRDD